METLRNLAAIAGVLNVLLVGFVGFYIVKVWDALTARPQVSLSCHPETRFHEVSVFGARSLSSYHVELFVGPQDGSRTYYPQGEPDTVALDGRTWAKTVRLGNPFGIGYKKRPPLDYDLVVVLRNARYQPLDLTKFPGGGTSFSEWVSGQRGIDAVATCRINRKPELALVCVDIPRITSLAPTCCAYNANGHACTLQCNPSSMNKVRSPVLLQWDSDALMYVEIYQNPPWRSVDGFPRKRERSGQAVDLSPGIYEMKIRQHEDDECISSSWFEVVPG